MGRLGLAPFGIRQCILDLGIKPAVACLHQFAEVVLRNGDGRIFLCLAWSHATLEAANDRVRIWVLKEDKRDAIRRHGAWRWHRDAMAGPVMPPSSDRCLETVGKVLCGLEARTLDFQ